MSNVLKNARDYVRNWTNRNNIEVRASGEVIGVDVESVVSTIWLDYIEEVGIFNLKAGQAHREAGMAGPPPHLKRLTKEELEDAWIEYPGKAAEVRKQAIINQLSQYSGENEELYKWLCALTGAKVSEIDLAIMQHFLWQIKRKALGLPVVYHICPIFFGKQGGGKTTAIQKLLSPIEELTLTFNPDEATDSRVKASFGKNLACFFDEMANMARVEMEELKKLITAETLTYRPMRTNKFAIVRQNCSFIGGSNKSMTELIYDPTGMRRFYEFTCQDRADFEGINGIDYIALYNSINVELERGYIEHLLPKLAEHQQARQTEDEVQHFVRETGLLGGTPREITASELYSAFIAWRAESGYGAKTAMVVSSFGMRLSSFKVPKRFKRVNNTPKTVYTVNAESAIFNKQASVSLLRGNA